MINRAACALRTGKGVAESSAPPCLFVVTLIAALVGCGSTEPKPVRTVSRFLQAINDKDINTLLTCIDPRQERTFRASFRIIEDISGSVVSVEDLLELVPGLYQAFSTELREDFMLRDIHIGMQEVTGPDAEIPVSFTILLRSEGLETQRHLNARILLRDFEQGWRITGLTALGEKWERR